MIAKIIWFTGLSGSGKSTLSLSLSKILLKLNVLMEMILEKKIKTIVFLK